MTSPAAEPNVRRHPESRKAAAQTGTDQMSGRVPLVLHGVLAREETRRLVLLHFPCRKTNTPRGSSDCANLIYGSQISNTWHPARWHIATPMRDLTSRPGNTPLRTVACSGRVSCGLPLWDGPRLKSILEDDLPRHPKFSYHGQFVPCICPDWQLVCQCLLLQASCQWHDVAQAPAQGGKSRGRRNGHRERRGPTAGLPGVQRVLPVSRG